MDLANSYTKVALNYTVKMADELRWKPKDRELLDAFAVLIGLDGVVCDLGCGPGQVAKYLKSKGLNSFGVDISPGMLEEARKVNPDLKFQIGDMLSMPLANNSLDGTVAFYSLIHIGEADLPKALSEIWRTLKPGGVFLFSFHIGGETIHLDEWWTHSVNIDFHFFQTENIKPLVLQSGFDILDIVEREPYDEIVEHQSRRAYFLAKKVEF